MHPPALDCTHGLVGQSPQIRRVQRLIETLAANDAPVLILGETGTGKEVVARAIYDAKPRGEFVPIDCTTLSGSLIESELFGHARGSFTGAVERKKGLIEIADGGTAFFDEIGDLPLEMQAKLLRVLQEQEIRAVGSLTRQKVSIRVLAATNRNLEQMAAEGRFRADLYYRLNIAKISLPPLRERKEDIPLLIEFFLRRQPREVRLAPRMIEELVEFEWPGNVRQLKHCIDRMVAMTPEDLLQFEDLPSYVQNAGGGTGDAFVPQFDLDSVVPLSLLERRAILHAVSVTGDKEEAARRLGIGRTTLFRKLKEYGSA
jgi:transcriptional regulator with PAS, ATPase and Fis domain